MRSSSRHAHLRTAFPSAVATLRAASPTSSSPVEDRSDVVPACVRPNAKLLGMEGLELLAGGAEASDSTDWLSGEWCRREDGSGSASGGCCGERRGFVFWASTWFRTFTLSAANLHRLSTLCTSRFAPCATPSATLDGYHNPRDMAGGLSPPGPLLPCGKYAVYKSGKPIALRLFPK